MRRFSKTASMVLLLIICLTGIGLGAEEGDFLSVTGPCRFVFPKDHGPHPGYRTEWWYYTGNLRSDAGGRFGYQLTFFRRQIVSPGGEKDWPEPASAWRTAQIYLAHAALSDLSGQGRHYQAEDLCREALGMAGAEESPEGIRIFVKSWTARIGPKEHFLSAATDDFSLELALFPQKPPVLHGDQGYSRKGSTPERASCYDSITRMKTQGMLTVKGKAFQVEGVSWMDHEVSSASLEPGIVGWDWFSLQLENRTELMLYLLREKEGGLSSASSGTFVDPSGSAHRLTLDDFRVEAYGTWKSPRSGAIYPSVWRIRVPSLALELNVSPRLSDQEMSTPETTGVTYWEGSVSASGSMDGKPISGEGYVELTGYEKPFDAPM